MTRLPETVVKVIETGVVSEFATVSAAGIPIDTPTYCFASDDLKTIGVATGLAYPAKAERARRNPKVGLLLEGRPGQPVVLVRGMAAVHDADLQANAIRYIAETGYEAVASIAGLTWDEARKAVWYWTRIMIDVAPERIMWWDTASATEVEPHVWQAPPGPWPESDPAPLGPPSAPSPWPQQPWREIAESAAARGAPAHLAVMEDGWPLPVPVASCELLGDEFRFQVPAGMPWGRPGPATLTFQGLETFVGQVADGAGFTSLTVERALPQNPLVLDPAQVLQPSEAVRSELLARLEHELARRGQPVPVLPEEPPKPSRLARARFETYLSPIERS